MFRLFQSVHSLTDEAAVLRDRRYGVIEMSDGRLSGVHLRPWPKIISLPEAWWFGGWNHRRLQGDRCWLYYNQPRSCSNYLALRYIVSGREGSLASFHGGLVVLDEIARIKGTDAIVCDVTNSRISERLLSRWGWQRHVLHSPRRHYIKRFYGEYPDAAADLARYGATERNAAPRRMAAAAPSLRRAGAST
jgi:hypothetical protein